VVRARTQEVPALFGFEGDDAREKVIVLLTMCFALAMAMLDNTVVNVALPTIGRELGTGVSGLQWIVDAYILAFASFLLTGGIAGDRYGRKRMFLTGLTIFTLASALCGFSDSEGQLIVARALQGVGAALLMPGTLSIITVTFPAHERAKAIGLWAGMSGVALALGPTVGGLMVERLGGSPSSSSTCRSGSSRSSRLGARSASPARRSPASSTSPVWCSAAVRSCRPRTGSSRRTRRVGPTPSS
jgi:MFS family permease